MDKVTVRPAREEDISQLVRTMAPELGEGQVRNRWDECVAGYRQMLVAEIDGLAVGTVSIGGGRYQRPDSMRLFALDVGPEHRNLGIGSALMEAVENEAGELGLSSVHLEVAQSNVDAIRLYERRGYVKQPEPIIDRWTRTLDDGTQETVEEVDWVMVKEIG